MEIINKVVVKSLPKKGAMRSFFHYTKSIKKFRPLRKWEISLTTIGIIGLIGVQLYKVSNNTQESWPLISTAKKWLNCHIKKKIMRFCRAEMRKVRFGKHKICGMEKVRKVIRTCNTYSLWTIIFKYNKSTSAIQSSLFWTKQVK